MIQCSLADILRDTLAFTECLKLCPVFGGDYAVLPMNKIIDFFLTIGGLTFKRSEKKSHDVLTFDLHWIRTVEFWSDIGCVVNGTGSVRNCSGKIEHLFISENGHFYNQYHKLIAEDIAGFAEYVTTVEYDFHTEIKQRTYDMLRFFGWYEGRHIDTTAFE